MASSGTAPACPAETAASSDAASRSAALVRPWQSADIGVISSSDRKLASDNDINGSITLDGLKPLEAMLAVAGAFSGLDVEFPAMPRTDDMQIGLAEAHALIGLVGGDDFFDAMNQQSIANRAALMRTDVEESMQLALGANDTDLPSLMFNHIAGALRHISGTRYENFSHYQSLNSCRCELYDPCPAAQLTILARVMS